MSWKDWPYWLQWGILSITLGLLLVLIGIPLLELGMYFDCPPGEGVCRNGIISAIGAILFVLPTWPFRAFNIPMILGFFLFIAQFFIFGAFIGLIIERIKFKK